MKTLKWTLRYQLLAPLTLLISLSVTYLLWQHEQRNALLDQQERADFNLREASSSIEQRIAAYEQVLRGVQGLFAASGKVKRGEFKTYVDSLQLGADFAGIEAIGFLQWVPHAEKAQHIAAQQEQGLAQYQIRPEGEREFYAPVIQLELFAGRNHLMFGLDPYAEPLRRAAMEQARDSGDATITSKLELLLEADAQAGSQPGFVMFLPVYAKGLSHDNPVARRAALSGWVVASLRINKLMASLYGERAGSAQIKIYDGVRMAEQSLLYDSTGASEVATTQRGEAVEYLEVAGRTWALELGSLPDMDTPLSKDNSRLIGLAGIALSLLLTLLTWMLATGRSRALALAREMTQELRESETRLRHQAEHDALTELPNRALFSDHLTHALAQARRNKSRLALMFIDLDKFKPINDTLGHHVGDALLQVVARRLQGCVRESDIVGRLGGDEFVVLLPAIESEHDALRVAEKIRESLNQPFELEGELPLSISSSTGIAVYPEHGSDEAQLSKNADTAMYQAKDRGRNRVQLYCPKVIERRTAQ